MGNYSNLSNPVLYDEFVITSKFGLRNDPFGGPNKEFHYGIDIACFVSIDIPIPLVAVADGKIHSVGNKIVIHHSIEGLAKTSYSHLVENSYLAYGIKVGDLVKQGQIIGLMGNTGRSTGRHLHFEAWPTLEGKSRENPLVTELITQTSASSRTTSKGKPVYVGKDAGSSKAPDQIQQAKNEANEKVTEFELNLAGGTVNGEIEEVTDEEIAASVIGFYLPEILEDRKATKKGDNNIVRLSTQSTTPYAQNLVLSKLNQAENSNFTLLSTSEISSMVPFVEIYVIQKESETQENHILFPFDDYTQKTKIQNIFYDKTGRGGNIGIKSVDWKTLGTNNSNLSQVSVSIKIHIQDIQEIETIRNGVSLLDLLYPAGTRNPNIYDNDNFNIKLKLGWSYLNNKLTKNLQNKIDDTLLTETIFVSLYKHDFEFTEAGSVELNLEYIGMLETKISNKNKFNILEKISTEVIEEKRKLDKINNLKKMLEDYQKASGKEAKMAVVDRIRKKQAEFNGIVDFREIDGTLAMRVVSVEKTVLRAPVAPVGEARFLRNMPGYDVPREKIEEKSRIFVFDGEQSDLGDAIASWFDLNTNANAEKGLNKKLEQEQEALDQAYTVNLHNLLTYLGKQSLIKYFIVDGVLKQQLKNLSVTDKIKISKSQIENVKGNKKNNIQKAETPPERTTAKFAQEVIKKDSINNKISIDPEKVKKIIISQNNGPDKDSIVVPYTFLGNILDYYVDLLSNDKDITKNFIKIVLGDFGYTDFGDSTEDSNFMGPTQPRTADPVYTLNNSSIPVAQFKKQKKYANLADIPISIDSLVGWYNEHVINADLQKMSLHSFLRSMFSNLIPANLSNQITDLGLGVSRKILCSFNYLNIEKNEKLNEEILKNSYNSETEKARIIPFSNNPKNSNFYKLRAKSNIKKQNNVNLDNFLFIFSSNEFDHKGLKGNHKEDLDRDIFHFYVGEDRGLIKTIKFSREDNPALDAANITKANRAQTENSIIRKIYQADISLYGNTIFLPGSLIYIAPTYPGSRLKNYTLQRIGLGGYFRIIEVENFIEDGRFETKLKLKWQASGDGIMDKDEDVLETVLDTAEGQSTEERNALEELTGQDQYSDTNGQSVYTKEEPAGWSNSSSTFAITPPTSSSGVQ